MRLLKPRDKVERRSRRKREQETEASTVVILATEPGNGAGPMLTPLDIVCPLIKGKCIMGTLDYLFYA